MTRGKGFGFGSLHKALRGQSAGFTLIEVLIAISLLAVGMLAVASMQVSAITGNAHANRITEATTLAQDRLEELMAGVVDSTDFNNLASGAETVGNYEVNWVVNPNGTPPAGTAVIQVTVNGGNLRSDVVMTSVIINPNF
jgi:type IV pilus assembly protein PilV